MLCYNRRGKVCYNAFEGSLAIQRETWKTLDGQPPGGKVYPEGFTPIEFPDGFIPRGLPRIPRFAGLKGILLLAKSRHQARFCFWALTPANPPL